MFSGNTPALQADGVLLQPLDNGAWFTISVALSNDSVTVNVQGDAERCTNRYDCLFTTFYPSNFIGQLVPPFSSKVLVGDFASYLNFSQLLSNTFPVNTGIVGCIRNLRLSENETMQNLSNGFNDDYQAYPGCPREEVCIPNPCANMGSCISSWNTYSCVCTSAYTGPNCTEGKYPNCCYYSSSS